MRTVQTRASVCRKVSNVMKADLMTSRKTKSPSRESVSRSQHVMTGASLGRRSVVTKAGNGTADRSDHHQAVRLNGKIARDILDSIDCFIFDCDGVIWRGDSVIEGVPETLELLRGLGKMMFFVTNNSTKSRKGYLKKFTDLGLNVKAEEIFSSSFAAAAYFESLQFKKKVYVIGEVGIQEELDLVGVKHLGGPADADKKVTLAPGQKMEHDHDVGAVVVGFDRNINYYKIQYATLCIRENPGCLFVATNTDEVTHLTDAQEWAGNGSMVGAVCGSTGQEPIVVGKPAPFMLKYICDKYDLRRDQICMVGDRLNTDILFGLDGGLQTLLVLSGVTTFEKLESPDNHIQPHFYADKLADMLESQKVVA